MAGYNPYVNRSNLTMWRTRLLTYLSPYYEEVNDVIEKHAAEYNKQFNKLNSKI